MNKMKKSILPIMFAGLLTSASSPIQAGSIFNILLAAFGIGTTVAGGTISVYSLNLLYKGYIDNEKDKEAKKEHTTLCWEKNCLNNHAITIKEFEDYRLIGKIRFAIGTCLTAGGAYLTKKCISKYFKKTEVTGI